MHASKETISKARLRGERNQSCLIILLKFCSRYFILLKHTSFGKRLLWSFCNPKIKWDVQSAQGHILKICYQKCTAHSNLLLSFTQMQAILITSFCHVLSLHLSICTRQRFKLPLGNTLALLWYTAETFSVCLLIWATDCLSSRWHGRTQLTASRPGEKHHSYLEALWQGILLKERTHMNIYLRDT